ncbi:glycosyltransferase [Succinimonas sp.]|uniref:glycosyltransferase n=1 Tax=Succinimonas sp. TaxID=1936151 RepID=UPI0038703CDF
MSFLLVFLETIFTAMALAFMLMTGYELTSGLKTSRSKNEKPAVTPAESSEGAPRKPAPVPDSDLPEAAVLIPVCNEVAAVKRLISAAVRLDYPRDRLEVLVLDDSRAENAAVIREFTLQQAESFPFLRYLSRGNREGFKAGNIAYGISSSRGSLIAIFDADAVPAADFLKVTVPYFVRDARERDSGKQSRRPLGFLQTSIVFGNEGENFITRFLGLEVSHKNSMTESQRSHDEYASLTGSSCVWLRECISSAGGLSAQTLTEDVDLCYRAQLLGWRYEYVTETETREELPNTVAAMRVQRHRWALGLIGNAFLYFKKVLASDFSVKKKLAALTVMSQSFILSSFYLLLLGSLPMAFCAREQGWYFQVLCVTLLMVTVIWAVNSMGGSAGKKAPEAESSGRAAPENTSPDSQSPDTADPVPDTDPQDTPQIRRGFLEYFGYVLLYFPLSLYYFIALLENLVGIRGSFVPTPKSGSSFIKRPRIGLFLLTLEYFSLIYSLITLTVSIITGSGWTAFYASLTAMGFSLSLTLPLFLRSRAASEADKASKG